MKERTTRYRFLKMSILRGDPDKMSRGEAEIPSSTAERKAKMATSSTNVPIGPTSPADDILPAHLTVDDRVGLLRAMLLMRAIEERAMNLYRQGKVPGSFYDGFGQEAVSVGAAWAMAAADRLCVLHRDLGAHIVRGVTPSAILSQYMGREAGITGGRDGNVHFGDYRTGCVGMVSMLPDMMLVAAGMAMAFKLRDERRCALTWFGDGSTSRGDFHEAMNWAGVQNLPVIFVLENNQFAYSTPIVQQFAVNPVERAAGYGFPGVTVDGNDAEAVFEVTRQARERAINGGGPTLIEAVTMRMHGHGAHDDMKYVPKALFEEWRKKDPIDRQSARLAALDIDVEALRAEVRAEVDEAAKAALAGPMPDPATVTERLFHPRDAEEILLQDGRAPWSGFSADESVTP
jgi:pyruvate dehydrogenase E1 component alpha subunit